MTRDTAFAAIERALDLAVDQGDFRNGVTDSTGTIDEGNVKAGQILLEARRSLYTLRSLVALTDSLALQRDAFDQSESLRLRATVLRNEARALDAKALALEEA